MSIPREPVTVAGVEFDAMIDRSESYSAKVPEFPVDAGYSVSDNAALDAFVLKMTLYVAGVPITWSGRHGRGEVWIEQVCNALLDVYFAREPITVTTQDSNYPNMVIESIEIKTSADIGYAREIPITLKQVTITSTETAVVPDSYVRSGKSMTTKGNATKVSVGGNGGSVSPSSSSGSSGGGGGYSASDLIGALTGNNATIAKNIVNYVVSKEVTN